MNSICLKYKYLILLFAILFLFACSEKLPFEEVDESIQCRCNEDPELIGVSVDEFFYWHSLFINFQDSSGNNLLKGIGFDTWNSGMLVPGEDADYGGFVKSELYTLESIYEEGFPNPERYPKLSFHRGMVMSLDFPLVNPDYDYLHFYIQSQRYIGTHLGGPFYDISKKCDFAEKIIFRLTCPYLFGNNEAHYITTWWWEPDHSGGNKAICYRVEYGGREFPVEELFPIGEQFPIELPKIATVKIILDRQ